MYFLDRGLQKFPTIIDRPISKVPAISRKHLVMAWTPDHKRILKADIVYTKSDPTLLNEQTVLEEREIPADRLKGVGTLEPQNFVPPRETELTFSQYNKDGDKGPTSEFFSVNLRTRALTNHSHAPDQYDDPEGDLSRRTPHPGRMRRPRSPRWRLRRSVSSEVGRHRQGSGAPDPLRRRAHVPRQQPGGQRRRPFHRVSGSALG
jgi:hypothetical protein